MIQFTKTSIDLNGAATTEVPTTQIYNSILAASFGETSITVKLTAQAFIDAKKIQIERIVSPWNVVVYHVTPNGPMQRIKNSQVQLTNSTTAKLFLDQTDVQNSLLTDLIQCFLQTWGKVFKEISNFR